MDEQPDAINVWGTCLTEGCDAYMIPTHVEKLWGRLVCGVCGQDVTDITDIEPEEGRVLPEWILEMLQQQNSTN